MHHGIQAFVFLTEKVKKTLSQKEDQMGKLKEEIKNLKQQLTVQERITSNSESSNKKYLHALVESQGLLKSLAHTVASALGDMADGHADKTIKEEPK